jgi:phosphoglycolate phosphatase-like HAD superfamily hydrolase
MTGALTCDRLVLDVDQVLLDTRPSFYEAMRLVAAERGVFVSDTDIATFKAAGGYNDDWELCRAAVAIGRWRQRTGDGRALVDLVGPGGVSAVIAWADDPGDLAARCQELYWSLVAHERVWVDVARLVRIQEAGVRVAACTGRNRAELDAAERRLGFRFDAAITSDVARKPDAAALLPLLAGACDAWFVGDSVDDARCAAAARSRGASVRFCACVEQQDDPAPSPHDALTIGVDAFLSRIVAGLEAG